MGWGVNNMSTLTNGKYFGDQIYAYDFYLYHIYTGS